AESTHPTTSPHSAPGCGTPEALSASPSYKGKPAIDSIRNSLSEGISEAAARSNAELYEPRRKLPDKPIRVSMMVSFKVQTKVHLSYAIGELRVER
ncbi:MAG: hypothetical protein ACOYBO_05950, partial [Azonexus sp.]